MDSLKVTDEASAAVATAPRVSLAEIEGSIAYRSDHIVTDLLPDAPASLGVLTVCFLVFKNGFTVIGKSAPASPENFNRELGAKFAYEDAVRQAWPLFGFALRDRLDRQAHG
jgi:hypothetical protein